MSLVHFLFSFQGRTRRLHYWLFAFAEIVLMIALLAIFATGTFSDTPLPTPLWYNLFCLAILYPATAVTVKRTNDIGWSPLWAWSIAAISAAFTLKDIFHPFGDLDSDMSTPNMVLWGLVGLVVVLSIVIGCVAGTQGNNAHGPNPLAAAA